MSGDWPDPAPSTSHPELVLRAENHARKGAELVEDNRLLDALVELTHASVLLANVIQLDIAAGNTSKEVPTR